MKIKNRGYVLPVAIGVLVLISLGLLMFTSWSEPKEIDSSAENNQVAATVLTDDATLDNDSAAIDAQLKALDDSGADVDSSLNDTSSI